MARKERSVWSKGRGDAECSCTIRGSSPTSTVASCSGAAFVVEYK